MTPIDQKMTSKAKRHEAWAFWIFVLFTMMFLAASVVCLIVLIEGFYGQAAESRALLDGVLMSVGVVGVVIAVICGGFALYHLGVRGRVALESTRPCANEYGRDNAYYDIFAGVARHESDDSVCQGLPRRVLASSTR